MNPTTDSSKELLGALSAPFIAYLKRLDPDRNFWDYDFLTVFSEIAQLDGHDLLDTFKEKLDAGELMPWKPFE